MQSKQRSQPQSRKHGEANLTTTTYLQIYTRNCYNCVHPAGTIQVPCLFFEGCQYILFDGFNMSVNWKIVFFLNFPSISYSGVKTFCVKFECIIIAINTVC